MRPSGTAFWGFRGWPIRSEIHNQLRDDKNPAGINGLKTFFLLDTELLGFFLGKRAPGNLEI